MQPTLVFLCCLVGTALARYHDKTRFDRSIPPALAGEAGKQWSFTDEETEFLAYKDKRENSCYLENLKNQRISVDDPRIARGKRQTNVLYAPTQTLTKIEAWRIAGGRIVEFCKGRNMILLQDTQPLPGVLNDPFDNQIPLDENDILTKRVADVVLEPLRTRAKREVMLEEREKLNQEVTLNRRRRQAPQFRGRFRGQTQAQYLNTEGGSENDGRAGAEATHQSSRAVVTGSRGMGQAQSMSMGGSGCEDCPGSPGYLQSEGSHDRMQTEDAFRKDGRNPYVLRQPHARYYPRMPGVTGTIPSQPDMVPSGLTRPGSIPSESSQGTGSVPLTTDRQTTYPGSQQGSNVPSRSYPVRQPERILVYPPGHAPGTMLTPGSYPGTSQGTQSRGSEIHSGGQDGSGSMIPQGPGRYQQGTGAQDGSSGSMIPQGPGRYQQGSGAQDGSSGSMIPQGPGRYQQGSGAQDGSSGSMIPQGPGRYQQGSGAQDGTSGSMIPQGPGRYPQATGTQDGSSGSMIPQGPGRYQQVTGAQDGSSGSMIPQGPGMYQQGTGGQDGTSGSMIPQGPGRYPQGSGVQDGSSGSMIPGGPGMYQQGTGVQEGTSGSMIPGGPGIYQQGSGGQGSTSGSMIPQVPGMYPQGTGVITPEGKVIYPGGIMPTQHRTYEGIATPASQMNKFGDTSTGGQYPGGVVPGTGAVYPGVYYGNVQPGMTRPGSQLDTFQGTRVDDKSSTYPGMTGTIGTDRMYPDGQQGTNVMPGREKITYPGMYQPGTMVPGSGVPRTMGPGQQGHRIQTTGVQTGGPAYPGVPTGTMGTQGTLTGTGVPGSVPGTVGPSGTVPGVYQPGTTGPVPPGMYQERMQPTGILHEYYPPGTVPFTVPVGTGSTGTIPSGTGTKLTGDTTYPGTQQGPVRPYPANVYIGRPDTVPGTGSNIPTSSGSTSDTGAISTYPGMMTNVGQTYPGTQTGVTGQVGTMDQGKGLYPVGVDARGQPIYPTGLPTGSGQVPRYDGTQIHGVPGGSYPGTKPGYQTQDGKYPGSGAPGSLYLTDMNGNVRGDADGQRFAQYPGTGIPSGQNMGRQYPGVQYPTGMAGQRTNGEVSQYYQQGEQGGVAPGTEGDDANADSQASSSVKQVDSGTQASASSQGKYGKGTAQSQVTGTYSGSGSFMAQAGTSDVNKSAQTEVSGGKEGATSSAQGVGGYGKSQVQVQMDSESGATSTGAQSGGWNHGTNSQVQASSKGGMADAQANGEGSTSSQAQIGFRPYLKTDETVERRAKPFRGGGSASAQSGTYRGQSQSQLEGAFQYGITYTGAAQAGSGSGAAASRKPFNFNLTDTEVFKPFKPYNPPVITKDTDGEASTEKPANDFERGQDDLQTSSSSKKTAAANQNKQNPQNVNHNSPQMPNKPRVEDSVYDNNGDYDEEYDDEYYDPPGTQSAPNAKLSPLREHNPEQQQSQMIHVNSDKRYAVRVKQDSNEPREGDVLQPGQSLSGYPVPQGFRGRVTSISGKETLAHGDGKSQSQTVSLVPTGSNGPRETKSAISETRSLQTTHEKLENRARQEKNSGTSARNQVSQGDTSKTDDVQTSPGYYTVTNSVAGKLDGRSAQKKYEHRYYTKSSTCGYFTFSCNIVYGSNGRTKICKPKVPTYPDGTPVKC